MVPADSHRISRVPRYSGAASATDPVFAYGALTRYGRPFQAVRLTCPPRSPAVLQPRAGLDPRGLGWGAFARRYSRHHCCFLFLRVMRCFSSPGSPRPLAGAGIPPGGLPHSDTRGSCRVFAPDRGFSQLVASFIASESLGILHAPFSPFLFLSRPRGLYPGGCRYRGRPPSKAAAPPHGGRPARLARCL